MPEKEVKETLLDFSSPPDDAALVRTTTQPKPDAGGNFLSKTKSPPVENDAG